MNILFITDSFTPHFAPRMGHLVHFVESIGWNAVVITTDIWSCKELYHLKQHKAIVHRVPFSSQYYKKNAAIRFLQRIFRIDGELEKLHADFLDIANELCKNNKFDLIISSAAYSSLFARVACDVSRIHKIPCIADFRDIYEQLPPIQLKSIKDIYNLWRRKTQIYRRNRILKIVDLVTSVSKNNVDILSKINSNTRLVSNGFDSEFFFSKLQKESQSFKIIYGGKLYEEKRFQDPEMFFQALAAIKDRFKSYHIVSNFFVEGNCRDIVRLYAEKYNITDMIRFYDLLETSEYAVQIRQSQLGVIFANPLSRGVIPTKFYEYIGSGLPVMLVPDDEGDIASILREKKLGLAAKSVDQIVDFIKNVYELWDQNKPVVIEADRVEEFERRVLSAQFVEIAKNLVTKIYE